MGPWHGQLCSNPAAPRHKAGAFVSIVQADGITGLYRGLTPALIMTAHGGIQFAVYEELKRAIPVVQGWVSVAHREWVDLLCCGYGDAVARRPMHLFAGGSGVLWLWRRIQGRGCRCHLPFPSSEDPYAAAGHG